MIDSDPRSASYIEAGLWGRATLDALFKRNLARSPDRLAVCDSEDRLIWSGRPAFRLTFRQVDDIVSALAGRFVELGLRRGAVVALALPNSVETVLAILACGRAGLVPALMPQLWRAGDIARALDPLAAKALISLTRVGEEAPADFMRYAAAELFSVRYVMAFGSEAPDGVMSLDDCLAGQAPRDVKMPPADEAPADQPALITFAIQAGGPVGIERTHNHCVCSGLVNVLEAALEPGDVIASCVMPTSLAALATGLFSWLLTGGTLLLHQPFDLAGFDRLIDSEKIRHAVIPGALAGDLAPRLSGRPRKLLRSLVAIHNDVARARAFDTIQSNIDIIDVLAFDELAIAARRRHRGAAPPLPVGSVYHPAESSAGPLLVETKIGGDGTVLVRGPQVPYSNRYADGFRPTTLRSARNGTMTDTPVLQTWSRQAGIAYVGGLAVAAAEVERHLLSNDDIDAVKVVTVADPLFGQRVEAHIAPRLNGTIQGDAAIDKVRSRFASAGIGEYKVPARIMIDHRLRGDPHARQRGGK